MSYGRMDSPQRKAIEEVVRGERVIDLGCGDGGWSEVLVILGAECVIALDKRVMPDAGSRQIQWIEQTFEEYEAIGGEVPKIAFISWPVNRVLPALLRMIERAEVVIYLGKNTDGTACGSVPLFEHLSGRALLKHFPKQANTLTIYGGPVSKARMLTGEEIAARFFSYDKIIRFDEAEALAEKADVVTQLSWRG